MRVLIFLILSVAALAQQPEAQADAPKKIRLEGHVVNAKGEPVRKATVTLLPGGLQVPAGVNISGLMINGVSAMSTTTDENGAFVLDDVKAGNYQLTADRNGYVPQRYGARSVGGSGTPLTLKAGDQLTKLDISLTPQAVIAGRILDQDGDPVTGVQVRASRYAYTNGQRQLRNEGSTSPTDDQGNYRISGLLPGRYYLQAQVANARGQQTTKAASINVATYFPTSLDLRGAAPVDVTAGAELTGITIRLRKERVFTVSGTVVNAATGAPLQGVSVMIVPPADANLSGGPDILASVFNGQGQSDHEGKFELRNMQPGSYSLMGNQGGAISISIGDGGGQAIAMMRATPAAAIGGGPVSFAPSPLSGRVDVNVGAEDVAGIIMRMNTGATITGSLSVEGSSMEELQQAAPKPPAPPPGSNALPAPPGFGGFGIRLTPKQGVALNAPNTRIDADGTFQLTGVAPAVYYLAMNGLPQGYYVKSVSFSGADITRTPLDFSRGAGGELHIVVAKGSGTIGGTVIDSQSRPLQGATVSLWPKTPTQATSNGGVRTATTNQNGEFTFAGVSPAEYYVAGFDDLPDAGLAQYIGFLNTFAGGAATAKLDPNGSPSIQVKVIEREKAMAAIALLP